MTIDWDCSGCWRTFSHEPEHAERRLEKTTVYHPERVADAFVCPSCGSLIEPYLDEI